MTDPDAALAAIRRRITQDDADAMADARSELLARHEPDDRHAYCRWCGEAWPCDTYDIISTALGGVEA